MLVSSQFACNSECFIGANLTSVVDTFTKVLATGSGEKFVKSIYVTIWRSKYAITEKNLETSGNQ
jgi:hypothetical protein